MKNTRYKNYLLLPALAVSSLSLCSFAQADPIGLDSGAIIKAIKDVQASVDDNGKKTVALGFAGVTAYEQAMYQYNENLLTSNEANQSAKTVESSASDGKKQTEAFIKQNLQRVANAYLSTASGAIDADQINQQIKKQIAFVNNLTLGVPASDTLYANSPNAMYSGFGSFNPSISTYLNSDKSYTIGKPPINRDNYFSFASLITPNAYSENETNAAKAFVDYLTKSYSDPSSDIDMTAFRTYVNSLPSKIQAAALYNFISSTPYKAFQLALRSYLANQSVAENNLQKLMSERTPSKDKVKGIYDENGKEISNPSPLQVEQYQANHRVDDPKWIKGLQKMSAANVQREVAVELAQMLKQNEQAHLDRERILATLTAIQLQQNQQTNSTDMQIKVGAVNAEIQGLRGQTDVNQPNSLPKKQ